MTEGEAANDYMSYLKQIAQQTGDQHPDAAPGADGHLENVLSHPFEETYAIYFIIIKPRMCSHKKFLFCYIQEKGFAVLQLLMRKLYH